MDPSTLEMLIMLRFSKDLWDAREVDQAMKRTVRTEVVPPADAASTSSTPLSRSLLADDMISSGGGAFNSASSSSSSFC